MFDINKCPKDKDGNLLAQTRDGRSVTLIATEGREPWPLVGYTGDDSAIHCWTATGTFWSVPPADGEFLINIPEPKRSGEIWMNQFDVMGRTVHDTREEADKFVEFIGDKRIACVGVSWTEGEGLEGK